MHVSRQQLKSSMLPVAIMTGALFYKWMGYLSFLSPYLIFLMLFITYCKLDVRQIRPTRGHLLLLVAQFALSAAFYLLSYPLGSAIIKSWQQAFFAAATTSSWVALGHPNLMLFSTVSAKR